jgi:hypothetical protein
MHPSPPPIPTLLYLITRLLFGEKYEAPHCVIFSSLLIRPPPEDLNILPTPCSLSCRLFSTFRNIEWQGSGRKRSWRNRSSGYPSILFEKTREITKSRGSRANCTPEFEIETLTTRSQLNRKQRQKSDCPVSSEVILKQVTLDSNGIRKYEFSFKQGQSWRQNLQLRNYIHFHVWMTNPEIWRRRGLPYGQYLKES